MALALLVHVDGQVGGVFTMLGKVHNIPDTWSFVAVVPALAIIYALGLIVTTGSALFVNWLQHPFKEKEKDALAVMADAKNDLLNLKFGEIILSWKTLEGMFIPLLFLFVGIIQESFRYSHLDTYLRYAALLVLVLPVLCPMYAWHIAKSVDNVLEAALDGAGANLSHIG